MSTQPDVLAVYLFGSYARGHPRPGSDVDLAVLLSTTDDMERFERRLELIGAVDEALGRHPADVVVLNDAPPLLTHQVLAHGRLIVECDRLARVDFEGRAGKIYADLQPIPTVEYFSRDLFQKIREVGLSGRRRYHQGTSLVAGALSRLNRPDLLPPMASDSDRQIIVDKVLAEYVNDLHTYRTQATSF